MTTMKNKQLSKPGNQVDFWAFFLGQFGFVSLDQDSGKLGPRPSFLDQDCAKLSPRPHQGKSVRKQSSFCLTNLNTFHMINVTYNI